jgi:hypothetical protein
MRTKLRGLVLAVVTAIGGTVTLLSAPDSSANQRLDPESIDPCSLVTKEEAEAAVGTSLGERKDEVPGGRGCFRGKDDANSPSVEVQVLSAEDPELNLENKQDLMKLLSSEGVRDYLCGQAQFRDVSGVDAEAVVLYRYRGDDCATTWAVWFVTRGIRVAVGVDLPDPEESAELVHEPTADREAELSVELARKAASRLASLADSSPNGPPARKSSEQSQSVAVSEAADEPVERPQFTRAIQSVEEVNWSLKVVGTNALLALLLVVLMPFPAALFNSTLSANYEAVRRWFRLKPRPAGEPGMSMGKRWLAFLVLILVTAALNSALDPSIRLDRRSLTFFLGLLSSIAVVNLVSSLPDRLYMRMKFKQRPFVKLFPLALVVAVVSIVISRLVDYRPGYLFGLIAGIGFSKALSIKESGWSTVRATVWMFVVAGLAWLAWIPVKAAVETQPDQIGLLVMDTTLAALFAAGVAGNMFGLLPLKFLGGGSLLQWNRLVWALLFGFGVFTFLQTLIEHLGDGVPRSSIFTAAALFVGFGFVSVVFWSYFRIKNRTSGQKTLDPSPDA